MPFCDVRFGHGVDPFLDCVWMGEYRALCSGHPRLRRPGNGLQYRRYCALPEINVGSIDTNDFIGYTR